LKCLGFRIWSIKYCFGFRDLGFTGQKGIWAPEGPDIDNQHLKKPAAPCRGATFTPSQTLPVHTGSLLLTYPWGGPAQKRENRKGKIEKGNGKRKMGKGKRAKTKDKRQKIKEKRAKRILLHHDFGVQWIEEVAQPNT